MWEGSEYRRTKSVAETEEAVEQSSIACAHAVEKRGNQ